jgi:hypothetical protein
MGRVEPAARAAVRQADGPGALPGPGGDRLDSPEVGSVPAQVAKDITDAFFSKDYQGTSDGPSQTDG